MIPLGTRQYPDKCCGHDRETLCDGPAIYRVIVKDCVTCLHQRGVSCRGHNACTVHAHIARSGRQPNLVTGAPVVVERIAATFEGVS